MPIDGHDKRDITLKMVVNTGTILIAKLSTAMEQTAKSRSILCLTQGPKSREIVRGENHPICTAVDRLTLMGMGFERCAVGDEMLKVRNELIMMEQ